MTGEHRKFLCPEFVFGHDSRLLLAQYIINFGVESTLIVTDKNIQSFEWFKDMIQSLDQNHIRYHIYDDPTINPKDYEVKKGSVLYNEFQADLLVAIGGGSVIDCAKGIGILVANGGIIEDFEGVDQIEYPIPPLICVPTTSGSAADVSQFAIITNSTYNYKMALASKTLVPDLALVDPVVTLTCGFELTVDTGLDALVHAIEAYVSNGASFATDIHALEAIKILLVHLPILVRDLNNIEERTYIMQACLNAGIAFSNASLGLVHAMAHALGGRLNLIHGELNGLLVEKVIAFNYDASVKRYDYIRDLFVDHTSIPSSSLSHMIHTFVNQIRPNKMISEMSKDKVDYYDLARYVLKDPCVLTNPKKVTLEDVVKIYEQVI